jgi:hypothetical protein
MPSPSRLKPSTVSAIARGGQHEAPFRHRRLGAEAKEAEARGRQHRGRDAERADHHHGRHDVGQEMHAEQPEMTGAGGDRALEIGLALLDQHHAVGDPGVERDRGDADRDHRVGQPGAEDREAGERDHDLGEREQDVDQAHQDPLEPAAGVAADEAEQQAAGERDADRDHADLEGQPGAVDDPAEQVAAEVVGAEPVLRRGRLEARPGAHLQGIIRRDRRREEGTQDQQQHDREAELAGRAGGERAPPGARARGLDLGGRERGRHQPYRMRGSSQA